MPYSERWDPVPILGLPRLESVAHAGENILGKIRDGDIEVTPDAVSLVLQTSLRYRIPEPTRLADKLSRMHPP